MDDQASRLLKLGYEARRGGCPADAKTYFERAVDLSRHAGNAADLAQALTASGQIERDLHRPDVALGHYEEALALCRGVGDAQRIAHTVRHVGDLHRGAGRLDMAEPCYAEALKIYRADPGTVTLDLANTLRGFALLKEATGDEGQARSMWQEAGELYQSAEVEAGVAEAARRLARLAAD